MKSEQEIIADLKAQLDWWQKEQPFRYVDYDNPDDPQEVCVCAKCGWELPEED